MADIGLDMADTGPYMAYIGLDMTCVGPNMTDIGVGVEHVDYKLMSK